MAIIPLIKYLFMAATLAMGLSLSVLAEPIIILEYRQTSGTNDGASIPTPFALIRLFYPSQSKKR